MKIRNIHPCGDVVVILPGETPKQFDVKRGEVFTVTKAEAAVLLSTPDNFEAADEAKDKE